MLINHDPGEGVAYIYLTEVTAKVSSTKEFGGNRGAVLIDFDEAGDAIGVEVLS